MTSSSSAGMKGLNRRHHGGRIESGAIGYGGQMRDKNIAVLQKGICLITGSTNPELAEDVANILQVDLNTPISYFNGNTLGELDVNIAASMRQKPTFIMQSAYPSGVGVSNGLVETIMLLSAVIKASSGERTVWYAPMAYQRKDRPDDEQKEGAKRQAIGSSVVLHQLEAAGADRFMTAELHALQELGMTEKPYDALFGSRVLIPRVREDISNQENTFYLSPDYGGGERARKWNEYMHGCGSGYMQKKRSADGVKGYQLLGDVGNHHVMIVDDICATGGTLQEASRLAHENGALSVSAAVVHGEFNNNPKSRYSCMEDMRNAGIERIFTTDTIFQREAIRNDPMVTVVPIAPLIAEAFRAVVDGKRIHDIAR